MTLTEAKSIARRFIAEVADTGRQWSIDDLEGYLPDNQRFRDGTEDTWGAVTVANLATFIVRHVGQRPPLRGGARPNTGPKTSDGAKGMRKISVSLDEQTIETLAAIDDSPSVAIRKLAAASNAEPR